VPHCNGHGSAGKKNRIWYHRPGSHLPRRYGSLTGMGDGPAGAVRVTPKSFRGPVPHSFGHVGPQSPQQTTSCAPFTAKYAYSHQMGTDLPNTSVDGTLNPRTSRTFLDGHNFSTRQCPKWLLRRRRFLQKQALKDGRKTSPLT
jgi:hypothetical protein